MRPIPVYGAPNLGKSWLNQKLVANQDNKKYIALDTPVSMTPQKVLLKLKG
jgi:hypothetical protein